MPPVTAVDSSSRRVVTVFRIREVGAMIRHRDTACLIAAAKKGRSTRRMLTRTPQIRIVARLRVRPQGKIVANTAQAKKRVRQAEKHRTHNTARRSLMRTELKKALKAVESKDNATSMIDRLARKGVLHKNTASRHKSRLNNRLRAMASA